MAACIWPGPCCATRPDATCCSSRSADAYGGAAGRQVPIDEDYAAGAARTSMPRPRRRPIWRWAAWSARGCAWCGCGRSTTPGPASRRISWCPPSRARSRGSPRRGRRRCCRSAISTPGATSWMCATSAPPMWRASTVREALAPGTILNLGSGQARRIGDVLDGLLALAGVGRRRSAPTGRGCAPEMGGTASAMRRARARCSGGRRQRPGTQTLRDVLADWHAQVATERGGA